MVQIGISVLVFYRFYHSVFVSFLINSKEENKLVLKKGQILMKCTYLGTSSIHGKDFVHVTALDDYPSILYKFISIKKHKKNNKKQQMSFIYNQLYSHHCLTTMVVMECK